MKEIKLGDLIKIRLQDSINSERIWAKVVGVDVEKQTLSVELNNTPVSEKFKFRERLDDIPVSFVLDKWMNKDEKTPT